MSTIRRRTETRSERSENASSVDGVQRVQDLLASRRSWERRSRVLTLFLLYAVQGVPFGFIDNFLPLTLYAGGASLSQISIMGAIGLPWMFKWVWAPLIDAYGSSSFGRRKSWIVPSHLVMLICCVFCACTHVASESGGMNSQMAVALLLWAFATAVEDCAVDGFAISVAEDEATDEESNEWFLAAANFAQVVGFKAGYMYSSAPLWTVHRWFGWGKEMWLFMALPIGCVAVLAFLAQEPKTARAAPEMKDVLGSMRQFLRSKRTRRLMILVAVYKAGEKMLMSMFKPALVDAGYQVADVGNWVGLYGTLSSTIGSATASFCLPWFSSVAIALRVTLVLRASLFAVSVLPFLVPQIAITFQGFGNGIITPIMFAYLMEEVSGSACAVTHYTMLQCCDDLSRTVGQTSAGHIATHFGYQFTFCVAIVLSILPLSIQP